MPDLSWTTSSTFLAFLAGAFGILATLQSSRETRIDTERRNQLLTELKAANREVIAAQRETIDLYTGADSIFHLHPVLAKTGKVFGEFRVLGSNPVRSVRVEISNVTALLRSDQADKSGSAELFLGPKRKASFEDIWPGSGLGWSQVLPPPKDFEFFEIVIQQPRDRYFQFVGELRTKDEKVAFAYKLFKQVGIDGKGRIMLSPAIGSFHLDDTPDLESDEVTRLTRWVETPTLVLPGRFTLVEGFDPPTKPEKRDTRSHQ